MEVSKINSANANIQSFKGTEQKTKTAPQEVKDGKKKLAIALTALGIAAAAGIAIYKASKGQAVKLSDIKFDKGLASLKESGNKFTGIIKDNLKNGDKVILEYENGIIKNSSRTGANYSLQKIYTLNANGEKLVKIIENGKECTKNITLLAKNGYEKAIKAVKKAADEAAGTAKKAAEEAAETAKKAADEAAEAAKKAADEAAEAAKKAADDAAVAAKKASVPVTKAAEASKQVQIIDLSKEIPVEQDIFFGYTLTDIKDLDSIRGLDKKEVIDFLEKNKSLTPDELTKAFGTFFEGKYDVPDRFLIAVNNQLSKTGSSLIVDEVPEMFKGIRPDEIQKAIEKLQLVVNPKQINQFTINGKTFYLEYVGSGQIGKVFRLKDTANNSVILKFFKDSFLTGTQGAYAEIPIARQASLEKVADVPKFFMANPFGKRVNDGLVQGAWHMVEDITPDKQIRSTGPKFLEWLKSKGLTFGDYNSGSKVGGYIVDLGGVIKIEKDKKLSQTNLSLSDELSDAMLRGMKKYGESVDLWIEKLKQGI